MKPLLLTAGLCLLATPGHSDPATIVAAEARPGSGGWTVSVTLRHGDTGWDDYADGWRVLGPDSAVLATRVLLHPHETEQPFTRSQSGVRIPAGITSVEIESSTNVTGWGGERFTLTLPAR